MRLKRFRGRGVHGFLRFDLRFNEDVTFLTGNNGSGKTSAINAIVGLVTPDFGLLANLVYDEIVVDVITNDGKNFSITAIHINDDSIGISASSHPEQFVYNKYIDDSDEIPYKQIERENEYYRELLSTHATHPVLKAISSLPTPMFLGLDRRSKFSDDRRYRIPPRSRGRNSVGGSLTAGILDAASLAEGRNREAIIHSSRIAEELQVQTLLNLITVVPGESADFIGIKIPTKADRQEVKALRRNLPAIAELLRLKPDAVAERVTPLLDKLEEVSRRIPDNATIETIFGKGRTPPEESLMNALFAWSANQPQLERIQSTSRIVEQFSRERTDVLRPIETYRALINSFFADSGKKISFNDKGDIALEIQGVPGLKPITFMSSGEAQLFVILTHLSFNSSANSNVFIIDEPEISLHVRWQELFVDSLISANSNIQYVLATHSPSIILDRIDRCIESDALEQTTRKRTKH